jgi:hypothetical protein
MKDCANLRELWAGWVFYLSNHSASRGRQPCGPLLQELPSSSRKLLSRSVPARRGRSGALIGGKEPSSAKPRRPSATDCGGSIPRSRKARADMWSRRRSSNRRQNRLRPPTRRDRRQPNDSQPRLEHRGVQKVGEQGRLRRCTLRNNRVEIGNGTEPQLPARARPGVGAVDRSPHASGKGIVQRQRVLHPDDRYRIWLSERTVRPPQGVGTGCNRSLSLTSRSAGIAPVVP